MTLARPRSPSRWLRLVLGASIISAAVGLLATPGVEAQPVLVAAPTNLTFANQPVGTDSVPQTVTLTNPGTLLSVALVAQRVNGPFLRTSTCGFSLGPGASCSVSVAFRPLRFGNFTGNLYVDFLAPVCCEIVSVALSGSAFPVVSLSATTVNFPDRAVGAASAAQTVTLSTSVNPLTIDSIGAEGDFAQTNSCGSSVAFGTSCTISIVFAPTAAGARTGRVTISDNAFPGIQLIALAGNGTVAATPTATTTPTPTATTTAAGPTIVAHDTRYFSQTGFRIDDDTFWSYFNARGGVRTFGFPVSRTLTFLGTPAQFFQRAIMQKGPDGSPRTLNLLDPDLMPYTQINSSTFPGVDASVVGGAPVPGSPNYGTTIIDFIRANAPETFEGLSTRFYSSFIGTVTLADAFPGGGGSPNLLPALNLELWGAVTSRPAYDPTNRNFVYLRCQRGIMHFDNTKGVTQGLLLADYLKAIITGQNLPGDLDNQAKASKFYKQYDNTKPLWVARPADLSGTDLTNAFTPG